MVPASNNAFFIFYASKLRKLSASKLDKSPFLVGFQAGENLSFKFFKLLQITYV
jgi:hypothetical protein